jgi:exodeoxyribonuclease V alpha subunit
MSETNTPLIQDELQQQAITLACGTEHRIVGITGQAGTGKTTIQRKVYDAFTEAGYTVAVAAPTGKAAKRIQEATGLPATTLHRLLEFTHPGDPDEKTGTPLGVAVPRRNRERRLDQAVVLVDEYSMVHEQLNRDLLDAIPPGGLVRMFGDVNQLPPIEEGNFGKQPELSPFQKHLKMFPSVILKNIYRQGEGSGVVKNGHRILQGFMPQNTDDFKMVIGGLPDQRVLDIITEGKVDYTKLDNQIIVPMHRGSNGTRNLNEKIQQYVQGKKMHEARVMPRNKWDIAKHGSMVLCPGDKILWKKNDYQLEIFNGETGIVEDFLHERVIINFGDRTVAIPPWVEYLAADGKLKGYDPRTQMNLAYAITTHASQGSEYANVIYVMANSSFVMQDRNNFYTAITRARKNATVISDLKSMQSAVSTQRMVLR